MGEEKKTVSTQEYERVLRQLNVANDNRRNLDRQMRVAADRNQKLVAALGKAKAEIEHIRISIAQDVAPPLNSAVVLATGGGELTYEDFASAKSPAEAEEFVDVMLSGRRVRITCSPLLHAKDLEPGMTVLLNDHSQAVISLGFESFGEVVTVREVLSYGRAVVDLPNQAKSVVRVSGALSETALKVGDSVTYDSRIGMICGVVPSTDAQELVLEEVPDVTYADIGGLSSQIDQIQDAVELPFLNPEIFREYNLTPPKGILLYGPPGNGKTLIAKAVANSLASRVEALHPGEKKTGYFLNIKGPELLDKYVGETERQIRDIFSAAREKAVEGNPVVVFFDEMESLFRTRGTGRSSDIETTIVPQLLSEIDGVESLDNVIVIGATNREDMIDPAVLRPGRLDVKIRINRPDRVGAAEIFRLYLNAGIPLSADLVAQHGTEKAAAEALVTSAVSHLFAQSPANHYLRVELVQGETRWLYRGDFLSGAVIRNIVDAAKKLAIKDQLDGGLRGITEAHVLEAIRAEFEGHVEVPQYAEIEDVLATQGVRGAIDSVVPARGSDAVLDAGEGL